MSELIRSETFNGTVDDFRAIMQQLFRHNKGEWAASNDERLKFREARQTRRELVGISSPTPHGSPHRYYREVDITPPTRGSWEVIVFAKDDTAAFAGIEADQKRGGTTKIECWDGYSPDAPWIDYKPIGAAFVEFAEMVVAEMRQAGGEKLTVEDKEMAIDEQGAKTKSKRGPRKYSRAEKIAAYKEWAELDRDVDPRTLEQWLEDKFGITSDGLLNVPPSTFYGWAKLVKDS